MITENKQTIIWLEDNSFEDELTDIADFIERKYTLRIAGGIASLKRELDAATESNEIIAGVILDMMIHGITDLTAFDMPDVNWDKGFSRVGALILKYIFRNSKSGKYSYLEKVPILFLSVKSGIFKDDFKEYGENIEVIQKYGRPDWSEDVKKWINTSK